MGFVDFLKKTAVKYPKKTALKDLTTGQSLSYEELYLDSLKWAEYLKSNGVLAKDKVVYVHKNSLEHLLLFFACNHLGAVFVPLNWRMSFSEQKEILDLIQPKLLFVNHKEDHSKPQCALLIYPLPWEVKNIHTISVKNLNPNTKWPEISLDEPSLMLFTSGSTGFPKGVMIHGRMLKSNQEATVKHWELIPNDKTLIETPFFHTGGYNVLLLPLLSIGGTGIIAEKFDADVFFDQLQKEQLSVYFAVPTMFKIISQNKNFSKADFSSIRFLISGGAYCPEELIYEYQEKGLLFKQGFGLTEVGPNCFLLPPEDALKKVGSIGKPMPHSKVLLIKDNQTLRSNEVGELAISGKHVCKGYYKNKNLFKDSLFKNYFKTGDLARYDEEGFYYIVGRIKDMYISGGENVYPAEVERQIAKNNKVKDCVVVSKKDPQWGEVGVAFYEGDPELQLDTLRAFLNPFLARFKHPHYLIHLEKLPLLSSGKVDKNILQQKADHLIPSKMTKIIKKDHYVSSHI